MTIGQTLLNITEIFTRNNISDAHFEARILLGYLLMLSPAQIYTQAERCLTQKQTQDLKHLVDRRLQGEPVAYILSHREFYGIDFFVDSRVLIPRPETELLVETALALIKRRTGRFGNISKTISIADIGTGCGNIAISLAKNIDNVRIYATDISSETLDLARYNSHYHKVTGKIIFRQGNLLEPVTEPLDMIIANLPYIKTTDLSSCSTEITDFEPRIALDGGLTGLSQISELLEQISNRISHQCKLLLEIGAGQENQLSIYLRNILPHSYVRFLSDLNGIQRVASIDIFN